MIYCPLWSIATQAKTECMEKECGMVALCRPELIEQLRPIDVCPRGHKNITDITGSEYPDGVRLMVCLEEDCGEQWLIKGGG